MEEALSNTEKKQWMKAIESEIASFHTNKVRGLSEIRSGRKAIGH